MGDFFSNLCGLLRIYEFQYDAKKITKILEIRDAYLHKVSSLHLFTLRFFIKFCKLLSYQCNFFGHRFGFSKSILEIKTQNVKHLLTCCLRLSELLTDVNVFHSCWLGTIYVLRNEDLGFSEPPSPLWLLVLNGIQNCHFILPFSDLSSPSHLLWLRNTWIFPYIYYQAYNGQIIS